MSLIGQVRWQEVNRGVRGLLSLADWAICAALSIAALWADEARKVVLRWHLAPR